MCNQGNNVEKNHLRALGLLAVAVVLAVLDFSWAGDGWGRSTVMSHPPMRPLPQASRHPMEEGLGRFVDPVRGSDDAAGSRQDPWRTINHALEKTRPGETIYLHGGVYFENVTVNMSGTSDQPITLRSYPGELAVLDAGYREFQTTPSKAWKPFAEGASGEFVSARTYPDLGAEGLGRRDVGVTGNFADSMIPLHGYHSVQDLRADPADVTVHPKDHEKGLYCGPGVWYNLQTQRIHIRLAHTVYEGLGSANYSGPDDPRTLALVIGGHRPPLTIQDAAHVVFRDLVLRGTRSATLRISEAEQVVFDHISIFGGSPAIDAETTQNLKMLNCAVRGVSAPWSSRASEKYRGLSSYLVMAGSGNRDFEFAHSEFTDCHDGLVIGSVNGLNLHHSLVENFNDDGLYLTTGLPPGDNVKITQNRIARCLSCLAFAGSGEGQQGKVAYIARNVFDLRQPINRSHTSMGASGANARPCGDHGSPIWKPMMVYQNTFLLPDSPWRQFYGSELTRGGMGNVKRRLFNNIFFYVKGTPGLLPQLGNLVVDGNLHWSLDFRGQPPGDLMQDARQRGTYVGRHDWFEHSKEFYPAGSTTNDLISDPRFKKVVADWRESVDLSLRPGSPAIDAGVPTPAEWPDPLRDRDQGGPDMGAVPIGVDTWSVGIEGRIGLDGQLIKE